MIPFSFFAYGTLKRGQVRAFTWPFKPTSVQIAFARAKLFDLGPYPALAYGDDWIQGELWSFQPEQIPTTLQVIDDVEGYSQSPMDDLYDRQIIDAVLENGEKHPAFCYFFLRWEKTPNARYIEPSQKIHQSLAKSLQSSAIPPAIQCYAQWPDKKG